MGDLRRHRLGLLERGPRLVIGNRICDAGGRGVERRSGRKLDASEKEPVVLLGVLVGGVNWKIAVST